MRSSRMSRALVGVAVIATTLLLNASVAIAQSYPGGNKPPPVVKGKTFFRPNGGNPADTGNNVLLLILLALLALAIGVWLKRRSRRRVDGREA